MQNAQLRVNDPPPTANDYWPRLTTSDRAWPALLKFIENARNMQSLGGYMWHKTWITTTNVDQRIAPGVNSINLLKLWVPLTNTRRIVILQQNPYKDSVWGLRARRVEDMRVSALERLEDASHLQVFQVIEENNGQSEYIGAIDCGQYQRY